MKKQIDLQQWEIKQNPYKIKSNFLLILFSIANDVINALLLHSIYLTNKVTIYIDKSKKIN